jgi:hypothetical protein
MSRCINDAYGVVGLTLSQIGLFLATGILLVAVFSLVFGSNWQRTADIRSLATSFSTLLADTDTRFFENTTLFQFPEKNYDYRVHLSTEFIGISTKGFWDDDLVVTERLYIQPWLRSSDQNWTTGQDLHAYLNTTTGHQGTENDHISLTTFTYLRQEQNTSVSCYALHPLQIVCRESVFLEKVTICYDDGKKYDILLVYQLL